MTARAYYVHGVELVNVGGEPCSACDRPAVGRSLKGHLICATHAGWAAEIAEEMALEKEASAKRRAVGIHETLASVRSVLKIETPKGEVRAVSTVPTHRHNRAAREAQYARQRELAAAKTHFKCGHPCTPENTYYTSPKPPKRPYRYCRQCQLDRGRKPLAGVSVSTPSF